MRRHRFVAVLAVLGAVAAGAGASWYFANPSEFFVSAPPDDQNVVTTPAGNLPPLPEEETVGGLRQGLDRTPTPEITVILAPIDATIRSYDGAG